MLRDIWPGNADRAAEILTGQICVEGNRSPLSIEPQIYETLPQIVREDIAKFLWLRDLACLGTEEARIFARTTVSKWMNRPLDSSEDAVCAATRLCALVSHYEFFARTADEPFRQRLMRYLVSLGRMLPLARPVTGGHWSTLSVIRGMMVAAFYLPGLTFLRERALRNLEETIRLIVYPDGCVRQRSPNAQFQVVRELTEMSAILRMAQQPVSEIVMTSLGRLCPVLRAMRHGDGGLALFNGGWAHDGDFVERVIQYAGRQKIVAPSLPDGRLIRLVAGKMYLLVDGGGAPEPAFAQDAHAAPLSFEVSFGRERVFVNCGSSRLPIWNSLLRQPAAHNSLETDALLQRQSGTQSQEGGRTPLVTSSMRLDKEHPEIELSFIVPTDDVSRRPTWTRKLILSQNGSVLRGKDIIFGAPDRDLILRFHLAPGISVEADTTAEDCLLRGSSSCWRFTHRGATLSVEEGIYFGNGFRQATKQLVLKKSNVAQQDNGKTEAAQTDLFTSDNVSKTSESQSADLDVDWVLNLI